MPVNTPLIANVPALRATWKPRAVSALATDGSDPRLILTWVKPA